MWVHQAFSVHFLKLAVLTLIKNYKCNRKSVETIRSFSGSSFSFALSFNTTFSHNQTGAIIPFDEVRLIPYL
jgi:hypothetical protein